MLEKSLFTKIIDGEIPCHKIYEDEKTFAFLNIYPVQPGHILVVPKVQTKFVWDLSKEEYAALMETVFKLGKHMRAKLNVPHVGIKVIGIDVPHAHVHLIPFTTGEEFHHEPDQSGEPDHEVLAKMAEQLRF